jgi:hypothetical protein
MLLRRRLYADSVRVAVTSLASGMEAGSASMPPDRSLLAFGVRLPARTVGPLEQRTGIDSEYRQFRWMRLTDGFE